MMELFIMKSNDKNNLENTHFEDKKEESSSSRSEDLENVNIVNKIISKKNNISA